ncbi:MAG: ABC transporter permease [Desulfobacula sp.]|nr:ABC transporter permease [Desulfobacula sp.]
MSRLNPIKHFLAFRELVGLLTRHRQLTFEMAKREITERYSGQVFGAFWTIGHPLCLMGVYVFIFAVVFKIKIGGTLELPLDYTTYLLSGLIPWMCFQETLSKGAGVIIANANLVKQVIFPIEILPVKGVIVSLLNLLISLLILIIYVLATNHSLPAMYLMVPILVLLQTLGMIGASYILSSVGVYFRDLKDFIQVFCMIGMYIMPIFYLPSQVPAIFRFVLYINPFSYLVWCYQDILYFGRIQHWWVWAVFAILCLGAFYVGYRVFRKLKTMFGNVL